MLTLKPTVASVTALTTSPARVKIAASKERPFTQFLRGLVRALAAVQA